MSESVAKIIQLERRVMWRTRMASLQNGLSVALVAGGGMAAAALMLVRLKPLQTPSWIIILVAVGVSCGVALIRWLVTLEPVQNGAFLIDRSIGLEDRVATSNLIIARGGPAGAVEQALIEDTAERLEGHRVESIVPMKLRRISLVSLLSLIAMTAAWMIPQRAFPLDQSAIEQKADILSAGEQLEANSAEIEQLAPSSSETANLAREQAELGSMFKRSAATRSDALKKLSALEERIRQRHDDLASTHADEIVSMSERRLSSAVSSPSPAQHKIGEADESQPGTQADSPASKETSKESRARAGNRNKTDLANPSPSPSTTNANQSGSGRPKDGTTDAAKSQKVPQEPVSRPSSKSEPPASSSSRAAETNASKDAKPPSTGASATSPQGSTKPETSQSPVGKENDPETGKKSGEESADNKPSGAKDTPSAIPGSLAAQAAKALPKLSEDLLKKAAQLRANDLSPSDIEKLRKAAELLSRELEQIAQSKELQQALKEMASQMRPEQIEQVARELGNKENLKQELQAAGKLLAQNQQAKEMVAGLAEQFARTRDQIRKQTSDAADQQGRAISTDGNGKGATEQAKQGSRLDANGLTNKVDTSEDRQLLGKGKDFGVQGKLQKRDGGQYLYLQTKAGTGAARVPYSAAYPQYRRDAERSVQKSQVPAGMRLMVRKYFDAINPDAKR